MFRGRERSILPPSLWVRGVDRAVEKVMLRWLDREPEQRPKSALEVLAALPGGDALAESLAGGDTPSPELVAASGGTGLLPMGRAIGIAAAVVAAFALLVVMSRGVKLLTAVELPNGPEVLRHKAEQHLESLGIGSRSGGAEVRAVSGFEAQKGYLIERRGDATYERHESAETWRRIYRQDRMGLVDCWFRQQPGD